jgi:hypothetical protein
MPKTYMQPQA